MYIGLRPVSLYGYTHTMNELYNETIERRGKIYHYDPDMDCYYCRYSDEVGAIKWAWLVLVVIMAICAYCIEYRPGLV